MDPSSRSDFGPLVDADWLAAHLNEPGIRVLDVRWHLGEPGRGRREYDQGHIPKASFIDIDTDITASDGPGRHPLPGRELLQAAMRHAGVDNGDRVIVYDDSGGGSAARLWWLLRLHGHADVALLDGGMRTWRGDLEKQSRLVEDGNFEAAPEAKEVLRYQEVVRLGTDHVVLDARSPERYRGDDEPIDPIAGHIPGARNIFWHENLAPDGRFRSPEELRRLYSNLGAIPGRTVVYCGSGITSCHNILAIELAGLGPALLYAGSWSDWCTQLNAPIATGGRDARE